MNEKILSAEPEKEKFVIDGICALVIGYEVLVKQGFDCGRYAARRNQSILFL